MFPSTTKEAYSNANHSPKHREANRSTYLPYFKRFPNQRFLSHQRRKQEEPVPAPPRRFFTQEKHQQEQQATNFGRFQSSTILKDKTPSKLRPKLFRQKYERESNKIKRASEASVEDRHNRIMINSSFQIHQTNYLTPMQAIKATNNLTDYELHQIISFQEIYYSGQNCSKKVYNGSKPKEGDEGYPWAKGDHIAYRYQLLQLLGQGSFGQVFRVIDHKNNRSPLALKMVKNNEKYLTQSKIEVKILKTIKQKDPVSSKNCIEIRDFFQFRGRMCMTFTLLSMNLYELIKSNGYYGLPLDLIRRFVLQILNGIHFLHRNKIIHADLKPENILLKEMNKSGIKIIDFGSSCFEGETIYTYIQSRYYRAPEVILGMPYDRKIDIWSFGCIIAELHLGYPLFGGEDQHEQISFGYATQRHATRIHGDIADRVRKDGMSFLTVVMYQNPMRKDSPQHPSHLVLHSKIQTRILSILQKLVSNGIFFYLQRHPQRRIQALDLMKHRWVLKDLPPDFRDQHLKYIHDEEQEMQQQETMLFKKSRKQTFSIRQRHRLIK